MLNELQAHLQTRDIRYWRDKNKHEVDFVLARRGRTPDAIECKWSVDGFDPKGLLAFRRQYPDGGNWVVARDVDRPFRRAHEGVRVDYVDLPTLLTRVS